MQQILSPLEIGRRIKARRYSLAMKQKTLAGLMNMSQANLSRIESGQHHLTVVQVDMFAKALNCDPGRFLVRVEPCNNSKR